LLENGGEQLVHLWIDKDVEIVKHQHEGVVERGKLV